MLCLCLDFAKLYPRNNAFSVAASNSGTLPIADGCSFTRTVELTIAGAHTGANVHPDARAIGLSIAGAHPGADAPALHAASLKRAIPAANVVAHVDSVGLAEPAANA